jgi:hypothetical protein
MHHPGFDQSHVFAKAMYLTESCNAMCAAVTQHASSIITKSPNPAKP